MDQENEMRILFMGTPDFAAHIFEETVKAGYDVIGVVTKSDKARGRSDKLVYSEVKQAAIRLGVPVYQPGLVRKPEFIETLKRLNPDLIIVVAFGQILSKEILELPKYGCINVHASLLPKYRGAAPIQWAVINGDEESGVSIMQMDEGLDTGDVIAVGRYKLDPKETGGSLFDKLADLGARTLIGTLDKIEKNAVIRTPQQGEMSIAGKLDKTLGHLDFTRDAVSLERLIRGVNPWPGAYTYLDGKQLKIWAADVADGAGKCGEVIDVGRDHFTVACGSDALMITELQLEGKKRMPAADFLRGNAITKGTVLG